MPACQAVIVGTGCFDEPIANSEFGVGAKAVMLVACGQRAPPAVLRFERRQGIHLRQIAQSM
jgi:hypothetical protein